MRSLSPTWIDSTQQKIDKYDPLDTDTNIDITTGVNKAAKFVIVGLANRSIPFKVYNLGAGVKRITTNVDTCPCCKRKL